MGAENNYSGGPLILIFQNPKVGQNKGYVKIRGIGFPLFLYFRNGKSVKIRGTCKNKGTQNKGPTLYGKFFEKSVH